jgi:hypothetical protein
MLSFAIASTDKLRTLQINRMLRRLFWRKPWPPQPRDLHEPYGMLGPEERSCFNWIAKDRFSGEGVIVDAGAFLGASAFSFASGLSGRSFAKKPIHSYDYFAAVDDYVIDDISRNVRPIKYGESYLDIFLASVAPYQDLIETHVGNFLDQKWTGDPIEVLFIDIAKTSDLNAHLLREFFPSLIPGRSIIIQQDFYHCWHPYIHATMEALRDHVEIFDPWVHTSRIYLVKREITRKDAERTICIIESEQLSLLDSLISREIGDMRAMMEVARLWHIFCSKDFDKFDQEADHFQRFYRVGAKRPSNSNRRIRGFANLFPARFDSIPLWSTLFDQVMQHRHPNAGM